MAEVMTFDLCGVKNQWQKLMLTLANQPEPVVRCCFKDAETARAASTRMSSTIKKNPSWFNLLVSARGSDVYVVKVGKAKKAIVRL